MDINEEINLIQEFISLSDLLDNNLEVEDISDNYKKIKIYFRHSRILCFSWEYLINQDNQIFTYRNITIEGEEKMLIKKKYLLEIFFTNPLHFDYRTVKIQNFPITENEMNSYLENYSSSYQRRLTTQSQHFSPEGDQLLSGTYQFRIVRNNHFIPQGYLRLFCKEDRPNYIYNFKLNGAELEQVRRDNLVNIKNILYLSHFYSLGVELILSRIENQFFMIRDNIISESRISELTDQDKFDILKYILAQQIRTPTVRRGLMQTGSSIIRSMILTQEGDGIENNNIVIEFNNLYLRLLIERFLLGILLNSSNDERYREIFMFYLTRRWKLISAEHMNFYTSDNPIVLYNDLPRRIPNQEYIESLRVPNSRIFRTQRLHGLMETGIQLYFPISPRFCLLIHDPHPNQRFLSPVDINRQILIQCDKNILSNVNIIENFLQRTLRRYNSERIEFINMNLTENVEEI